MQQLKQAWLIGLAVFQLTNAPRFEWFYLNPYHQPKYRLTGIRAKTVTNLTLDADMFLRLRLNPLAQVQ